MPHNAAALIALAVLCPSLTMLQTPNRLLHCPELLVARDDLYGPAPGILEEREVADDIEEVFFA
jgi:hypothetical protein